MAVRAKILVNNFTAGEISPELHARVDLAKYANACETLENWLPLIEGGMTRRPGTKYVATGKYADRRIRLVPFVFSTVQAYVLEFGDGYIRFYKDWGRITTGDLVTPIELTSPYVEAELVQLKFRQDADTLYIWHPAHTVHSLTRTSHTDWAIAPVTFADGPFLDQNSSDSWAITVSGGEIVVNGTFASSVFGWADQSVGTGSFAWNAGGYADLIHGGGADIGAGETSIPTTIGVTYTVTFTVGGGNINAQVGTATGLADVLASAVYAAGARSLSFVAKSSTSFLYFSNTTAGTTRTLDTVSCLKPLHTGAAVTLTATQATWTPEHVGAYWRIGDANGSPSHDAWTAGGTVSAVGQRNVYNGNVYEATSTGTNGVRPPVHLRGVASDGNNTWTFINDGWGYVEINGYTSATEVSGVVRQHIAANAATGTTYWAEGSFSAFQGYPRCGAFVEQRLAHAGTVREPFRVEMSETGNYEGYKAGTEADRAMNFVIASNGVNALLWMEKGVVWFAGTNGAVYAMQTGNDTPLAPDNPPNVKEVFSYGAEGIQPLKVGGNLLFVQRGGRRVREIDYEAGIQNDIRSDRTVLARHITSRTATITEWAYEQEPNSTVWAVRTDGVLLALTYFPEQEVIAWSRHITDGFFRSVATIPVSGTDQTWLAVERTINGQQVWQIEYFDETLGTDSALTYFNPDVAIASVNSASVSHLLGKRATIVADGGTLEPVTVAGSDLSLGGNYVSLEIGLPFYSDCVTVRPEVRSNEGTTQGIVKAMTDLTVRVLQTNGLTINGQTVTTRGPRDYLNVGPPFVTGDLPVKSLGLSTDRRIRIQKLEPFPAKIVGVFATVDAGDN